MGHFEYDAPTEFVEQLKKMENIEILIPKILEAAAPPLVLSLKNRIKISQQTDVGEMYNSIKKSKVYSNKDGHFLIVRPTGKDKNGIRNMEKFAWMEYGRGGTSVQPPRPMIQASIGDVENEMMNKMQSKFEEEVR